MIIWLFEYSLYSTAAGKIGLVSQKTEVDREPLVTTYLQLQFAVGISIKNSNNRNSEISCVVWQQKLLSRIR